MGYDPFMTAEDGKKSITDVLYFHVTNGTVLSTDLVCGGLLEMMIPPTSPSHDDDDDDTTAYSSRTKCERDPLTGNDYLIQKGGGNRKNDIDPIVLYPDIIACDDSVVHIISEVMLPNFVDQLSSIEINYSN